MTDLAIKPNATKLRVLGIVLFVCGGLLLAFALFLKVSPTEDSFLFLMPLASFAIGGFTFWKSKDATARLICTPAGVQFPDTGETWAWSELKGVALNPVKLVFTHSEAGTPAKTIKLANTMPSIKNVRAYLESHYTGEITPH